jgi:hypothetical protein
MNEFYELLTDHVWHLKEYHEILFFPHNKGKWSKREITRLLKYEHFDIRLFPFEGSDNIKEDCESEEYRIQYPPQLFFSGNFETVEGTDYPVVDGYQLPIISKKFLNVLESVKPFDYDAIPITIFDASFVEPPLLPDTVLKERIRQNSDYIYLKCKRFVMMDKEVFDKHARLFTTDDYAVIEPYDGLDPIFRIKQAPEKLFISEAAHKAIDEFNAKQENNDLGIKIKGLRLLSREEWHIFDY